MIKPCLMAQGEEAAAEVRVGVHGAVGVEARHEPGRMDAIRGQHALTPQRFWSVSF